MSTDTSSPAAGRRPPVRPHLRPAAWLRTGALVAAGLLAAATAPAPLPAQASQAAAAPAPAPELSEVEKLYGLSQIWQEVNYNFAFFDQVPEVNWDSTYQAFIPQVLATRSTYEYYRVLQRFIALLRDGHTNVFMPPGLALQHEGFDPRLDVEPVGGRMLVSAVDPALQRQIPVGSEIVAVNGAPLQQYLQQEVLPYLAVSAPHFLQEFAAAVMLQGAEGTSVRVGYVTPRGQQREVTLRRDQPSRIQRWMAATTERFQFRWMPDRIAYVALNTFTTDSVAVDFEAVLPQLRGARGLILDLRKNGGGNSGVGYRIASWLTDDSLATSSWRTREHRAAHKAWGQYGGDDNPNTVYTQMNAWHVGGSHDTVQPNQSGPRLIIPTVVLQGHFTGSAAEDFLVAVDAVPHFTTVGQPSNGSTGQPLGIRLPGGGFARVVTKRDTYPDGRDFVGIGVIPDVRVEPTVEDVRARRDVVLQRGVEVLRRQLRG